jgi:hypothetical protein
VWKCGYVVVKNAVFLGMYKRISNVIGLYAISGLFLLYLHIDKHPLYMKKALLLALIAICGVGAKAQKIELGLNGGLAPYIWADNTFKNYGGSKKNQPGYYGSFRVSLTLVGFQFGLGADMFQTGVKTSEVDTFFGTINTTVKYNSLTPYLFLNKIFRLPKSYIYAGISGGYNTGTAKAQVSSPLISLAGINTKYSGFNAGMQLGFTLNLAKGLGANAEAGAKYIQMTPDGITGGKSIYQLAFPVSLGVRYTF